MNRQDNEELVLLMPKLRNYYKNNGNFCKMLIFYHKSRVIAAADFRVPPDGMSQNLPLFGQFKLDFNKK